jgi:hypothetical protein
MNEGIPTRAYILGTTIAFTISGLALADAGHKEVVCKPIVLANSELNQRGYDIQIPDFSCSDTEDSAGLPPGETGTASLPLNTEIGELIFKINPRVVIKPELLGRDIGDAVMYGHGEIVKVAHLGKLTVDTQTAQEDGVILVTQMVDGVDVGIDSSKLEFKTLAFETDQMDGKNDEKCPTPFDSPKYRGCYFGEWFGQGFTLFTDPKNEIISLYSRIFTLKYEDDYCTTVHAIPNAIREVLKTYGVEITNDKKGAALVAKIEILGMVKRQAAEAMGVSTQQILVHIDEDNSYDPGLTYSQRLALETRIEKLTDSDKEDDWCLIGDGGDPGIVLPVEKLVDLVHTAFSEDGWNYITGEFDHTNPDLVRPASADKYEEQHYE